MVDIYKPWYGEDARENDETRGGRCTWCRRGEWGRQWKGERQRSWKANGESAEFKGKG